MLELLRISIFTNSYVFIHFFISTFLHSYILTFLHSYILTFLHSYILTFLHSYILTFLYSCILAFLHSRICIFSYPLRCNFPLKGSIYNLSTTIHGIATSEVFWVRSLKSIFFNNDFIPFIQFKTVY